MKFWPSFLCAATFISAGGPGPQIESAQAVTLEFLGDIPPRGIFADDVRRVTSSFALHEAPPKESDLRIQIQGSVVYRHRTWNNPDALGRLLTTRILSEGRITVRSKGPELTADFSCDSGMLLAPAFIESPSDIDPAPSVEEVSACIAGKVRTLLESLLKREPRRDSSRDSLARLVRPMLRTRARQPR